MRALVTMRALVAAALLPLMLCPAVRAQAAAAAPRRGWLAAFVDAVVVGMTGGGRVAAFNGAAGAAPAPACVPFRPPNLLPLQNYCRMLAQSNDSAWDALYRAAPAPGARFPLDGCVLGCAAGRASAARGQAWGSSGWSGKCFRNGGRDVVNLMTPAPPGVDAFDWARGFLPTFEAFPGTTGVGPSWWETPLAARFAVGSRAAFTIDYPNTEAPPLPGGAASPLAPVVDMYTALTRGTRDELRVLQPGLVLGQVMRKPNSYMNPLPLPYDAGVRFVLVQVCARGGGFAYGGMSRDLS